MHKLAVITLVVFSVFLGWIIFMANTGQHTVFFQWVAMLPYGDKLGHVLLFGFLTFLANVATKFKTIFLGKNIYLGSLIVLIFVTFEELSQYFVASRTLDVKDYMADIVGITVFTFLSYWLAQRPFMKDRDSIK